jgi:transcription initiation factor TFIID subunit 7
MERQPIRDRALILRILVPGLETRLRDKMKEVEEAEAERANSPALSSSNKEAASILDLEGVACEPTKDGSSLFNFIADGRTYPARLVNLPCPIEIHKTYDHAMYHKSCDIAQMLIVYEDTMALDEADTYSKSSPEGFPSYHHSGLTPPMKRVVEKRFQKQEHQIVPPPRLEVSDVERDLLELMCKISKEGGKRNKVPSLASAQHANKVLEEIEEEIVDYEPWMDDNGTQPSGIEFDSNDQIASIHPEIWLMPEKIEELKRMQREIEEVGMRKKEAALEKKQKKKKKKKDQDNPTPSKTKGITPKVNEPPVDSLDQIALNLMINDDVGDGADLEFELDFDMNEDVLGLGGI